MLPSSNFDLSLYCEILTRPYTMLFRPVPILCSVFLSTGTSRRACRPVDWLCALSVSRGVEACSLPKYGMRGSGTSPGAGPRTVRARICGGWCYRAGPSRKPRFGRSLTLPAPEPHPTRFGPRKINWRPINPGAAPRPGFPFARFYRAPAFYR